MERSRSDSHSGSFSRRSFLKSASLGVCSTLVIGDFHNFVRLTAIGGRLTGKTYARSNLGETTMPTELNRA